MSKQIALSKNKGFALVDDDDFDYINQWNWHLSIVKRKLYAKRFDYSTGKRVSISMHATILGKVDGFEIDHKDGDGLNNQRSNLRYSTHVQNIRNRKIGINNKTGYKGVTLHRGKIRAQIGYERHYIHIGYFETFEEAAKAYDNKAIELFGEFAMTNYPRSDYAP